MNVIDCEKSSNFKFLLQVTAHVLCFLESSQKNPVLLPSKHPSVKMLVTDAHHNTKHGGVNDTLVALHCRYWMLKGRQIVKSIVRSCVICKKLEGLPYCSELSPDLPTCRVSDDPILPYWIGFCRPSIL